MDNIVCASPVIYARKLQLVNLVLIHKTYN